MTQNTNPLLGTHTWPLTEGLEPAPGILADIKDATGGGAWVAQLVKQLKAVMILTSWDRVLQSPASGSRLLRGPAFPSPSAYRSPCLCSFCQIN